MISKFTNQQWSDLDVWGIQIIVFMLIWASQEVLPLQGSSSHVAVDDFSGIRTKICNESSR